MNLIIPQLRNSASLFTETLPGYKEDIVGILNKFDVDEENINKVSEYLDNFSKIITDYIKGNSKDVITVTTEVATSVIGIISKGIITLVFAIYMIAQKETLSRQINKVMKAYLKPKTIEKITTVGSLPIFGAFIGTAIGFILIMMVSPIKAILFVVFIIILQQIEGNLIYPRVVGKSIGLPGMWVLLSVTVGGSIGGILGMLIATPLCSLLYALFTKAVNDRLRSNRIVTKVKEKA